MVNGDGKLPAFDAISTSIARRYNYWRDGGKDNFAPDRASGDTLRAAFPTIHDTVRENRLFKARHAYPDIRVGEADTAALIVTGPVEGQDRCRCGRSDRHWWASTAVRRRKASRRRLNAASAASSSQDRGQQL